MSSPMRRDVRRLRCITSVIPNLKARLSMKTLMSLVLVLALQPPTASFPQAPPQLPWVKDSMAKLETELAAKYGAGQRGRLQLGMKQVANFWRAADGDATAFEDFVRTNFASDQATLDMMFNRFEQNLEQLDGHMQEIGREFRNQSDLDLGPILPFDEMFAAYDPSSHVIDDFFQNKLAFTVLLNFPLTTLEQKLAEGERWSRRQWAEARLTQRFSK